jgi:hypothetical protein
MQRLQHSIASQAQRVHKYFFDSDWYHHQFTMDSNVVQEQLQMAFGICGYSQVSQIYTFQVLNSAIRTTCQSLAMVTMLPRAPCKL